ncbi:MAG TPA: mandelate racemase/muconate lactonizing enzyme family protein [Steroidobacteraceae bacterium]|nr:mandelate racemase/muconate lactonizing enzyme family protein [Steroidobacteraceae bacterium]
MSARYSRRSFLAHGAMAGAGALAVHPLASFGQALETAIDSARLSSSPSQLRITDVKCGFLRGGGRMFVKIHTNQGIWGCGEGVDAVNGTYQLVKSLGQRITRRNPLDVHRLFEDLRKGGVFGGAQSGVYVAVLSAIETALWDLAGKALGVPVYRLLGGKFRDRIRVYMDTALYQSRLPTPQDFAKAAKEAKDMGVSGIKFDLDQGNDPGKYDAFNWTASPAELRRMVSQVAAAREAVGPEIDICCDMHGRYDLPTGKQIAKMLEPYNLMWLEEPVPAENIDALKQINDSTSTPICAGENLYLGHGFRRALEIGAVDIVMPDLQKTGGLGEGQRIANLANLYYVPFAPHMVASFLGAMAAAHVCASVPNFMILEWQIYFHRERMWDEIVSYDGPKLVNGFIPLSEKPGIGVEINEEGMRAYAAPGVPFFE